MSRKLRVFISSTMNDLPNERDAVRRKLNEFNFEPVNAEELSPSGYSSWDKLAGEISACDIFVLILGDRYGWIPDRGPRSEEGLSVTHLEYQEAKALGIPILPFLKELPYGAERDTPDALSRDAFRKEVMGWENGRFVGHFKLASDLADNVGRALIDLLSDQFQAGKMRERAPLVTDRATAITASNHHSTPTLLDNIPSNLLMKVKNKEAVLFAGAGVSLPTGLPAAAAFSEKLAQVIRKSVPNYSMNHSGSYFAGIATDLEAVAGRDYLVEAVATLINPPQGVEPSSAHLDAVRLFDQIITTNYDPLFEIAARIQRIELLQIDNEIHQGEIPAKGKTIVKLHGSYDKPNSLLLTEHEILFMDKLRRNLTDAVVNILQNKTVIVVGSSLRDPSIIRLFTAAESVSGYFVAPDIQAYTQKLQSQWNLTCIQADANSFFRTITQILGA